VRSYTRAYNGNVTDHKPMTTTTKMSKCFDFFAAAAGSGLVDVDIEFSDDSGIGFNQIYGAQPGYHYFIMSSAGVLRFKITVNARLFTPICSA
jgi:hypothetical protein